MGSERFEIGDVVRSQKEPNHKGTVVAVDGAIEVEWHGPIAAKVRKRVVQPDWIEHIPPPLSVAEAEREIVRIAMEWFATEDDGYELERLAGVCCELREALRRQGATE